MAGMTAATIVNNVRHPPLLKVHLPLVLHPLLFLPPPPHVTPSKVSNAPRQVVSVLSLSRTSLHVTSARDRADCTPIPPLHIQRAPAHSVLIVQKTDRVPATSFVSHTSAGDLWLKILRLLLPAPPELASHQALRHRPAVHPCYLPPKEIPPLPPLPEVAHHPVLPPAPVPAHSLRAA